MVLYMDRKMKRWELALMCGVLCALALGGWLDREQERLLFVSCVPWLSYTALVQPTPVPADSNPRITWGKYDRQGERILLPVSLLANHALVDGIHIARFYQALERELADIAEGCEPLA